MHVRRVPRGGDNVFGETPIVPREAPDAQPTEESPEEMEPLEPRVRHAALSAALKAGAQACFAGVFMGFVLAFFIIGLVGSGNALLLGMIIVLATPAAALLAAWNVYRSTLESERQRAGMCPRCGYDLRGIVASRCPECGTEIRPPGRRDWDPDDNEDVEPRIHL